MVSNTHITRAKRERKKQKGGAKRKAADRAKGSTPKFAIHESTEKK